MTEKRRALRPVYIAAGILLICVVFCALLPLVPQPGLKKLLVRKLTLQLPAECRIGAVRICPLPLPHFEAKGVSVTGSQFDLQLETLSFDLSLVALLSGKIKFSALQLVDGRFDLSRLPVSGEVLKNGPSSLFPKADFTSLSLSGIDIVLAQIPGFSQSVTFQGAQGKWRLISGRGNERLVLKAAVRGGAVDLAANWFSTAEDDAEKGQENAPETEKNNRLEVLAHLRGVSLTSVIDPDGKSDRGFHEISLKDSNLDLDINGNPGSGLRFTASFDCGNHLVSLYDANGDRAGTLSEGALAIRGSGFFQPEDGYLNLKSALLRLPGGAALFTRGLVRFRKPFFVDLVSHLQVDDFHECCRRLPFVGAFCGPASKGAFTAELKLLGNLFQMPVFKVELKAGELALTPASSSESAPPDSAGKKALRSPGVAPVLARGLAWLAEWNWQVVCDCRIEKLQLGTLQMREVELEARKKPLQLEIERLAAEFGSGGRARLTMVVDDLSDAPRWQASLVAEKIDLAGILKAGLPAGLYDLSLVGEGNVVDGVESTRDLRLEGKWQLRQARLSGWPPYEAFKNYLSGLGRKIWPDRCSGQGQLALRHRVWRFKGMKLTFNRQQSLLAAGRFRSHDKRLDFSGLLQEKTQRQAFHLQGTLDHPLFTAASP
ncbi:MAG: hypothetical protein GXO34_08400 [Deltaproteobacteria bacterium]|nr:hypothetical protein [Deltaproteobacteria bacterium]